MKVEIPMVFRVLVGEKSELKIPGNTILEMRDNMETMFPALHGRMFKDGVLNKFINIYVDDQDIRFMDGPRTEVGPDSIVAIIPAIAGG